MSAPMDVDEKQPSERSSEQKAQETIAYPEFDIDAYASWYTGKIKVDRLTHVATVVPSKRQRVYELCAEEVKRGINVQLYDQVLDTAQRLYGAGKFSIDSSWMSKQQQENEKKLRALEDEIQRWRNLSNRERICQAYLEAAEFCVKTGNFTGALSKYIEAKSYAGDTKTLLSINLNIMVTSIQSGTMSHVKSEASHALASEEVYTDNLLRSKVLACLGLYYLRQNRYEMAVQYFVDCQFAVHKQFAEVISGENIALYGGLCALASFKRDHLKRRILDNAEFKRFLELQPSVLRLIRGFYDSEYGLVMSALNELKKDLLVDMYLHGRVDSLLSAIRGKALVQYFSPYSAMDMRKMSTAFNVSLQEMEKDLAISIGDGHINAKIDSHSKIVYASTLNRRRKLFMNVLEMGAEFAKDMKAVLLRMSLQKERVFVSQQRGDILMDLLEEMEDADGAKGGLLGAMGAMGRKVLQFGGGGGGQGRAGGRRRGPGRH